jgi:hypothetical protein
MTATLLTLPKLNIDIQSRIPTRDPLDILRKFRLKSTMPACEQLLRQVYHQRYYLSTALTTKLQIQEYLDDLEWNEILAEQRQHLQR